MDDDQPHHEGLEARIATAILPTLVQLGYELVRVQVSGKERPVVQIMADRADEATFRVEDCEIISHAVGAVLDVEDPIRSEWSLEVSSAGIDRPLTRVKDWNRYAGQLASVDLQVPQDNRRRLRGIALGADAQEVRLRLEDGTELVVPRGNIRRAKLVLTDALIEHSAALAAVADARRAALEPPAGEGDAALEPPAGEDDAALEPPVAEDESAEAPEVEEEAPPAPRRRSTPKRN